MIDGLGNGQKRILLIVEGERTEPLLLNSMFHAFGFGDEYTIVPLGINVHDMLQKLRQCYGDDLEDIELPAALIELYPEHEHILSQDYTDRLLIFDFDPHDNRMDPAFLKLFQNVFNNSTDLGQLYLSYPSIESYRDFSQFGDESFLDSKVYVRQIEHGQAYKSLVGRRQNGLDDVRRIDALLWARIVAMHMSKVQHLVCGRPAREAAYWSRNESLSKGSAEVTGRLPEFLALQYEMLEASQAIYTCCTCLFFICSWPKHIDGVWKKV